MKKNIYFLMGIALIIFIIMILMLSPWFNVKTIEVNGIKRIERSEIIRTLELDKSTNILAFSKTIARNKLKRIYYIEKANIKKELLGNIIINITEKEIIGYVPYINGFLYIDKNGMVVDIKPNYIEKLPIIIGLEFDNFNLGEILKTRDEITFDVVIEIARLIGRKEFLQDLVKLDVSNLNDIHMYINQVDVILGKKDYLNIKINTLNEIFKNFSTEEKGFLHLDDINKPPIFEYIT